MNARHVAIADKIADSVVEACMGGGIFTKTIVRDAIVEALHLPKPGQTRCAGCGWDASFQPPEIASCSFCGGLLLSARPE